METQYDQKKELMENLRQEWKMMWRSRLDDKVRAEAIADRTYERLFVDRGLILYATRGFKPPEFQEILNKYLTPEEVEKVNPNPVRGGVRKFIREYVTVLNKFRAKHIEETRAELENLKSCQQLKHGGRGWLHLRSFRNRT